MQPERCPKSFLTAQRPKRHQRPEQSLAFPTLTSGPNEARANSRRTSSSGSEPKGCLLVEKTLRLMQSRSGPPVQLCCPAYFLLQLCTASMLQMHRSCGVHHVRSKPQGWWGGLQVELPCFACTWLLSLSSMRPFRSRLEVPTILMM